MRTLVALIATLVALMVPAYAQKGSPGKAEAPATRPGEEERPVVDEKKYKAAVERIGEPQQQQKYDPWQNVRAKPAGK
jgi:hypothetical protein